MDYLEWSTDEYESSFFRSKDRCRVDVDDASKENAVGGDPNGDEFGGCQVEMNMLQLWFFFRDWRSLAAGEMNPNMLLPVVTVANNVQVDLRRLLS
ncbi:hypothetical protein L1887_25661 [Cichorium endivia]|nr:hypothetical protein L1887_25661 [Cichorium endivia]